MRRIGGDAGIVTGGSSHRPADSVSCVRIGPDHPYGGWLWRDDTQRLLAALDDGNGESRCVGGCVRDCLSGIADVEAEVDVATSLPPEVVVSRLRWAEVRTTRRGMAHGSVTAIVRGGGTARSFDVTTLRRDVETDGRHAVVAATDDWRVDAMRRDLTVNALYATADGTIYDPTGRGAEDLRMRRVRFVGDPVARIAEDRLRALRYVRFHFHIAPDTPPDDDVLRACRAAAPHVAHLARERKRAEFLKILALPAAPRAVEALCAAGLFEVLVPSGAYRPGPFAALCALTPDPLARLAALMSGPTTVAFGDRKASGPSEDVRDDVSNGPAAHLVREADAFEDVRSVREAGRTEDGPSGRIVRRELKDVSHGPGPSEFLRQELGESAERMRQALGPSNADLDRLRKALAPPEWHDAAGLGAALYFLGPRAVSDQAWLRLAESPGAEIERLCRKALCDASDYRRPDFPLTGEMLRARGILPGPEMGAILREMARWWAESGFPEAEALERELTDRLRRRHDDAAGEAAPRPGGDASRTW